ncbi:V-type ATP synthase subunit D [Thalassoglobus neptunius]|uniref:V-type ATP synthase subunit D n=1 Tax=Thalassoglobus neptunius TaxID=1938619 RepID=A0A5C5X625_9PLAN|nr:V-type ATP synthase subunit D [Thalassoglobus neptunius]TWT58218.1 V-type ATP synthase subunit D [Thalassoglobus neptunius]
MAKLKLSKNSLQQQQQQLKLYKKLLPSLDLKRRQLAVEAKKARATHQQTVETLEQLDIQASDDLLMLADDSLDYTTLVRMKGYHVGEDNVVGTRLPVLQRVDLEIAEYSRMASPAWIDVLVNRLKKAVELRVQACVEADRLEILNHAVRRITQRVNLFEKILIPTAEKNIHRIRIYLNDGERASVVTSKLAKAKQQAAGNAFSFEEDQR